MTITCRAALLIALSAGPVACADFSAPNVVTLPDVVIANPSFATDIQPIFTARCATASCHNLGSQQEGLILQSGFAYDAIVQQRSQQHAELFLVSPGDPAASRLVQMMLASASPRMPLGREPLTANQITTIQNWISHGARRN